LIPLNTTWQPAPNQAPPYYIWQNDPGLTEYLNANGTTGLCVPAAVSNAILFEHAFKSEKTPFLNLPGLTADSDGNPAVDSNTLIRYFARKCNYTIERGTTVTDGAKCIAEFYREAGYPNSTVRMIRKNELGDHPGFDYEDRSPTLQDIRDALANGDEVIASVVMNAIPSGRKVGSHSFNIYGVNADGSWIASNPTRAYRMNFVDPVFDVLQAEDVSNQVQATPPYSWIRITGRLIEYKNAYTFLAGLTLIHARK
jgi:hypothetical protein